MVEKEMLVDQAKELVGEKALLVGGGMVMNKFRVVRVKEMDGDRPVLETHNDRIRKPVLGSWKVLPMNEGLKDVLDLGAYFHCGDVIRRDDCGMFGSIHDCTVVYKKDKD